MEKRSVAPTNRNLRQSRVYAQMVIINYNGDNNRKNNNNNREDNNNNKNKINCLNYNNNVTKLSDS